MIWSMAGVLYEPAFAVITAACGKNAPRGIITLTLVGGFASTVCMPVTQYLVSALGWRHALWVLAGANLAICLPLHAWFVPRPAAPGVSPAAGKVAAASVYAAMARERAFWGLALWFTAYNAIGSALVFQFIPLMREWRLGTAAILSCMMRPHAGGGAGWCGCSSGPGWTCGPWAWWRWPRSRPPCWACSCCRTGRSGSGPPWPCSGWATG
jgi:hypothetical protein